MIAKSMIGLSALIAVGVVAIDMAQSRTSDVAPASNLETVLIDPVETLAVIAPTRHTSNAERKSDRLPRAQGPACVHEHWPYIADECLVATSGLSVSKPARTITIERKPGKPEAADKTVVVSR
jgi:hypothetical protein